MSSSASEKKTLEIRLTRKVVRDFVEHAVLPDLNGLMQPNDNGKANHKSVHDSDISGECIFSYYYFWRMKNRSKFLTLNF